MSVAERANTTFPVKFREKENGFAIMENLHTMRWKQNGKILATIGGEGMNDGTVKHI